MSNKNVKEIKEEILSETASEPSSDLSGHFRSVKVFDTDSAKTNMFTKKSYRTHRCSSTVDRTGVVGRRSSCLVRRVILTIVGDGGNQCSPQSY